LKFVPATPTTTTPTMRDADAETLSNASTASGTYGRVTTTSTTTTSPISESGRERGSTLLRRFQTGARAATFARGGADGRRPSEDDAASYASSGSSRSGVGAVGRGVGDRFGAAARRRARETRKAELSLSAADGRFRRGVGDETGGAGRGRSTTTFDVAENARLALEAKDAQLQKMAARLAALEAERDAEAKAAVAADARAFEGAANSLEDEMRAAFEQIRGGGSDRGSDGGSGPRTPTRERRRRGDAEAFTPVSFASRDGDEDEEAIEEDHRDDDDDDDEEEGSRATPRAGRPEPIKPSVPVEGGYLTPSGKFVGSALKRKTSDGKPPLTPGTPAPRDTVAATPKTVVFNDHDEYSDAPSAPVDASVVEELQTELREVRAALKSAFGVSEKLVAQCEKKNRELQEKNLAVKLAREEVDKSRAELRDVVAAAAAERKSAAASASVRGRATDEELRERLSDAMNALKVSQALNEQLMRVMTSSVGVNVEASPEVVFAVLPVLAGLAVRGDFAEALAAGGAFDALDGALDIFAADASVCRRALECILCMSHAGETSAHATDDDVMRLRSKLANEAIDACGRSIVRCAEDHVKDARVSETACSIALSFAECAEFEKISFFVRECRAVDVVCKITATHAANERVQRAGTCALAALATCDERTKRAVERRGGIDLIARCANELGVDDAVRMYPQVKRWISGVKSREDRERKGSRTRDDDEDDDEGGDDVLGNL